MLSRKWHCSYGLTGSKSYICISYWSRLVGCPSVWSFIHFADEKYNFSARLKKKKKAQFPCFNFAVTVNCHWFLWRLWLSWNSMWFHDVNCLICPRAIMLSRDSSSTTYCTLHLNGLILFTAESIFTTLLLPAVVLIPVWTIEWYQELFKACRP